MMKLHFRVRMQNRKIPHVSVRVSVVEKQRTGLSELAAVATNRSGYGILSIRPPAKATKQREYFLRASDKIMVQLHESDFDTGAVHDLNLEAEQAADLEYAAGLDWANQPLDIEDINLVPGVFPDLGSGVFGEGYCERILPTDEAPLIEDLYHVVKTDRDVQLCETAEASNLTFDTGRMLHYEARWDFLGMSLGSLLKSTSLLPCEKISVAVRDWRHSIQQQAQESQSEEQAQTTDVAQAQTLGEIMNATRNSFSVGLGATGNQGASAKGSKGPVGAGIEASMGISAAAAYSHDSYKANMQRNLTNHIQAAARASRQTHKISLVEVSENHSQTEAVRSICNNNHCHTLNVFFREVNENYKLSTRAMGWRDVIFVPYEVEKITPEKALCSQHIIQENLLDSSLERCFDGLARHVYSKPVGDPGGAGRRDEDDLNLVNRFQIALRIGKNSLDKNRPVELRFKMKDGSTKSAAISRSSKWKKNSSYTHDVDTVSIDPADIQQIGIYNGSSYRVDISSVSYAFLAPSGGWITIASGNYGIVKAKAEFYSTSTYQPPVEDDEATTSLIGSDLAEERQRQDALCAARLVAHLNCNNHYYNQLIWLGEDINERVCRFEKIKCDDQTLADFIDPTPVAVFGCSLAFVRSGQSYNAEQQAIPDERLITVPTHGVFADAALGRCTTCETKDDDVYWDWSESPCNCSSQLTNPGNVMNAGVPSGSVFSNTGDISNLLGNLNDLTTDIGNSALGDVLGKLVSVNSELLKTLLASAEATAPDIDMPEPPIEEEGSEETGGNETEEGGAGSGEPTPENV